MFIAWTTVATQADADQIATVVVAKNLAICVQVDGPIVSHYRWKGQHAREPEFRLMFKMMDDHVKALEEQVLAIHPYDTPEWIVVRAEHVAEKYLSWATTNSSTPPL
jgi:periplasmic divalent cation tolerance protein